MFLRILFPDRAHHQLLLSLLDLIIDPGVVIFSQVGQDLETFFVLFVVLLDVGHLETQVPFLLVTKVNIGGTGWRAFCARIGSFGSLC